VVDEIASLTSYCPDKKIKDRIRAALQMLLSQGRAVGYLVIAAVQDPRKEVLPFRDLFPTRIALRLAEAEQVDLVLGDGAYDRGAACERIPVSLPGVGYMRLEGRPEPVRVRVAYVTDDDITDTCHAYGQSSDVEDDDPVVALLKVESDRADRADEDPPQAA